MSLTEAMAHDHVYGDWRGDGKAWCAVCSAELPTRRTPDLYEAAVRLIEALTDAEQKPLLILRPRTKQAIADLCRNLGVEI